MDHHDTMPSQKTLGIALLLSVLLSALVLYSFQKTAKQTGTIVLPGGITYLGQTPTPSPSQTTWVLYKGKSLPYSVSLPASLSLGWFPSDPYDAITAFIPNTDSNANIFFRVEDLTAQKKQAAIGNLKQYATDWWKDYAWKGVSSVTAITTKSGLHGYRASYLAQNGSVPYDHVFLAVPEDTNRVIWVSGKLFTGDQFSAIVDSITWNSAQQ